MAGDQEQRRDNQHAHRVAGPPHRPGGQQPSLRNRAGEHQRTGAHVRAYERAGQGSEKYQGEHIAEPVELGAEFDPPQQHVAAQRCERVARRDQRFPELVSHRQTDQ
jgi:hypothetical protein